MEVSGMNPFLFGADDTTTTTTTTTSPQTGGNPFLLMDDATDADGVAQDIGDNPFFSFGTSSIDDQSAAATNPFMFEPDDYPLEQAASTLINYQNDESSNFFFDLSDPSDECVQMPPPDKPTDLAIKEPITVLSSYVEQSDETKMPPRRPPPPRRPSIPPPPPTTTTTNVQKELILSVTGAMDANSSHLLDRIAPTRTPSPVSMRDLQSPSPTPEQSFVDLVNIGDDKLNEHRRDANFLDLDDDEDFMTGVSTTQSTAQNNVSSHDTTTAATAHLLFDLNEAPTNEQPLQPSMWTTSESETTQSRYHNEFDHSIIQPQIIDKQEETMRQTVTAAAKQTLEQVTHQATTATIAATPPPKPKPPKPAPPQRVPPQKPPPPRVNKRGSDEALKSASASRRASQVSLAKEEEIAKQQCNSRKPSHDQVSSQAATTNFESNSIFEDFSNNTEAINVQQRRESDTNPFAVQQESFGAFDKPVQPLEQPQQQQQPPMKLVDDLLLGDGGGGDPFASPIPVQALPQTVDRFENIPKKSILQTFQKQSEDFDAFAAKFESATAVEAAFGDAAAWGTDDASDGTQMGGFGDEDDEDGFDSFVPPIDPSAITPARQDSDEDEMKDFAVFIRPKPGTENTLLPTLAPPPPKSPNPSSISDLSANPFEQEPTIERPHDFETNFADAEQADKGSLDTPATPLFDEDTSIPLEEFPRIVYRGEGWEMQLRQPNKKKITGQRFWKKIFMKVIYQGDNPVLQLFNERDSKDPFQELPLQACYSVSDIGAQQYDQFGKIFTIKLQYIFYKERPGVRPGQITKAERITNKLSKFAAYAIQGDYEGVKEFGSDLRKLGLPVEHAPQISQLFKIGSQTYEDLKQFSCAIEEALFRLTVHRDRALHYKMEEVQITAVDELYVEQNADGGIDRQIARVRLFFLAFLSGMPDIELGVNDMRRQGKEVVGRHDIIPVATEEWIRLENVEFHACVQQDEYHRTHLIKFKPPDACYIELLRFRVRPPRNRELPFQLKATMCVTGNKVELRADVLVPGFTSRKLGQIPCEDVMIRFPIPECWIYLFRVEKHFRYGSVKSTHRRTGKIKGIERILGAVDTLQESLIEVTSGQAKYEHQHRAIVWRCPRLPKEGQGAYTTHNLVCRMALTSYDQIPDKLAEYCYVEFTMPATQVSHTTVRSVSVQNSDSDEPPEKFVRYLARHEYRVGIEHTKGDGPAAYISATMTSKAVEEKPASAAAPPTIAESSESDSD